MLLIQTIHFLDLILLLGTTMNGTQSIGPYFGVLVAVMDLSLFASSELLGFSFVNHQSRVLVAVFLLNIGTFVIALILRRASSS